METSTHSKNKRSLPDNDASAPTDQEKRGCTNERTPVDKTQSKAEEVPRAEDHYEQENEEQNYEEEPKDTEEEPKNTEEEPKDAEEEPKDAEDERKDAKEAAEQKEETEAKLETLNIWKQSMDLSGFNKRRVRQPSLMIPCLPPSVSKEEVLQAVKAKWPTCEAEVHVTKNAQACVAFIYFPSQKEQQAALGETIEISIQGACLDFYLIPPRDSASLVPLFVAITCEIEVRGKKKTVKLPFRTSDLRDKLHQPCKLLATRFPLPILIRHNTFKGDMKPSRGNNKWCIWLCPEQWTKIALMLNNLSSAKDNTKHIVVERFKSPTDERN
jgi:hypothetical protein